MSTKISDLPSATSLTGSEEIPIVQTGTTKKATKQLLTNQNYSTTEQVVGTWIDGKPLYQIVISATAPTVSTSGSWVASHTAHNIANVDLIYVKEAIDITSTETFTLPFITNAGYVIKATVTTTEVALTSNNSGFSAHEFKVILNYTKTTDSAS